MSNTALLMSGGLDSIAVAYWKRPDVAITIDYGQVCAEAEIRASTEVCRQLGIEHDVVVADCRALGSGDMAAGVPLSIAPASDWWPFRNQLIVTLAAMKVVSRGAVTLWLGTVESDSQHADGTIEFIERICRLTQLQEGGMRVEAPAIGYSTSGLIQDCGIPIDLLAWAHSCHASNWACGVCRGCNKHRAVMEKLGHGSY